MTGPSPEMLADMYQDCTVTVPTSQIVFSLLRNRPVFELVEVVPWWVAGVVNMMECGGRLDRHLHNGDPLTDRTKHVPKGRPESGAPPFTWFESARDAMTMTKMHKKDWLSLGEALFALEGYNGFGYRRHGINSPYLWSGTNAYLKGKYVADGSFDTEAISKQVGIVPMMKGLKLFAKT